MATAAEHQRRYAATEKGRSRKAATVAAARGRIRAYIREVKSVPCMDCGLTWPYYVMHFDHRDPPTKSFTISTFISTHSYDGQKVMQKLKDEIDKCDIVCANCHGIRHHAELERRA